jgi:GntR family transcriptional regulator
MDFSTFDKAGSERLYLQIRRVILSAIRSRDLLPRQKVPSLNELSDMTGVSRVTVRQALQSLINEGWLFTVPGKGTFVAESPRIEQNLQQLRGWTDEIRAQGFVPDSKVIAFETLTLSDYFARWLDVPSGTLAYRITRVRYADEFALAVEKAHLVCSRYPGLDKRIRPGVSLYQVLQDEYHVQPVRAIQFLDASEADEITAHLLEIDPGKPVLISERITYSATNEPIELVVGIQKPGFVRFKTELNASTPAMRQIIVTPEDQSIS